MTIKSGTLALALLVAGFSTQARAQACNPSTGCNDESGFLYAIGFSTAAVFGTGGLITGLGSSIKVIQRDPTLGWFVPAYVNGTFNLGLAVFWTAAAAGRFGKDLDIALALTHWVVGLWNVVLPTIGLVRGATPGGSATSIEVAPTLVGGLDRGGQRWTGLGVVVAGF